MGYRNLPISDAEELTKHEWLLLDVMENELRNNRWTKRYYDYAVKKYSGRRLFDALYDEWYSFFVDYDYDDDRNFVGDDLDELYEGFVDKYVSKTDGCSGFTKEELRLMANITYDEREWLDERFDSCCCETDWRYMFDWDVEYFDVIKGHYHSITTKTKI